MASYYVETLPIAVAVEIIMLGGKRQKKRESVSKVGKKEILQDSNWCFTTLSSLLNDPSTHDVTFKTSDGGSVSAHRAIVAAGSPVFHAMLYGNMKESNEKEIKLPSVDTETLKVLLSFLYTGKIEVDPENCLSILEAACYFNVTVLEKKCSDFIAASLDIENCCTIATFANAKKFDGLLEKCLTFMYSNADKVIKGASFKTLPSELMLKFCQSSDLCIKEINLFVAVVEWYQHQKTNIPDNVIKTVLQQIRYPLISVSDLLEKVRPTKFADSVLYTSALEYHHIPSKYDGPQIQLVRRKSGFCFINLTTATMTINEDGSITRTTSSNDWNGLCAAQVYPTEQHPVHFKFLLKHSHSDRTGIQIVTRSCSKSDLSPGDFSGGMDGEDFTIGQEVDGVITIGGGKITTTIGQKTMTTTKGCDTIYLCIYLHYPDNSVTLL